MAFYLDIFNPATYARFLESDRGVAGFKERQRVTAKRLKPGDVLVCYLTRLSRFVGLLTVAGKSFEDSTPRFADDDPYVVRIKVKPLLLLTPEQGIPIDDDAVWNKLSMTKDHERGSSKWTGFFRMSLNRLPDEDGEFLHALLTNQEKSPKAYPLDDAERKALTPHVVRRPEGAIAVSVPDDATASETEQPAKENRESIKVQGQVAKIGAAMGFQIWLPANDKAAVLREWPEGERSVVTQLPLNYDLTTLGTIERIDVLWLKSRSIVRAFEVEHTTAIYSGLLRMADLLSLQPNMAINLHIVAPEARKAKVLDEIRRPVFSFIEGRPLKKTCTFLSYDSIRELAEHPHLAHLSDSILEEYEEEAE